MQINGVSLMPMDQAIRTMPLVERKKAAAINNNCKAALQADRIQYLVADELAHTVSAQLGQGRGTGVAQDMTQGFVDRQGGLLRLGQPIDIVQHPQLVVAQLEVQLATAAQLAAEQ